MSEISKLRSQTLFKKKTRHYYNDYHKLRKAHKQIFKNEQLSEDRVRVRIHKLIYDFIN